MQARHASSFSRKRFGVVLAFDCLINTIIQLLFCRINPTYLLWTWKITSALRTDISVTLSVLLALSQCFCLPTHIPSKLTSSWKVGLWFWEIPPASPSNTAFIPAETATTSFRGCVNSSQRTMSVLEIQILFWCTHWWRREALVQHLNINLLIRDAFSCVAWAAQLDQGAAQNRV